MPTSSRDRDEAGRDARQLEDQPFLNSGGSAERSGTVITRHRQTSGLKICFFIFLVVVTIFGLVLIPFGVESDPSRPVEHGHGDMAHGHEPEPEQGHDDGHKTDQTEQHKPEPSPVAKPPEHEGEHENLPKLRDLSEYILDRTWNTKATPTTREYNWTISNADLNPDGVYRPMILINNQFPGPLIECNEGDTIVVNIENKAVNATSIHFHGLFQNGTNHMDGTVGITQCPIAPKSTFTYKFQVHGQSGTYWYHAHHSAQASDGLLGPMIIHSKDELGLQKLEYDSDRIIMVQDHYHNLTSELLMNYLQSDNENEEPVPDNALINGRGVRKCADFPGWRCDEKSVSTPTIFLNSDKRHRLRFINVGAFAEFQIQFDQHPFQVTEVDGTDVHPAEFHRLNILPGQRYSVILERNKTTSLDSIWMRTRMAKGCFTAENKRLETDLNAIVRFNTTPETSTSLPTSKDWPEAVEVICRDIDITNLHPVIEHELPPPTDNLALHATFHIGDWRLSRGHFNDHTWHMNATNPSLHRFLDNKTAISAEDKASPFGPTTSLFTEENEYVVHANSIRTVDIFINNLDDGSHPFHLHGHKFYVLAIGHKGYPPKPADLPAYLKTHGLDINPLRRDTVTVEGFAWAVIRVVFDNPGLWAFHCHNTWHAEAGMLMQFLVRGDELQKRSLLTPQMRDMCKLEGVTSGMRPDDALWFGNFGD